MTSILWSNSRVARPITRGRVLVAVAFLQLTGMCPAHAQETRVILPGDSILTANQLRPFEAEYVQLGFPFLVRLVETAESRPILSFQMIVEGPNGVAIDHIGHHADDFSFSYRRFGFGAFGPEYIDARVFSDTLRLRRMSLDDDETPAAAGTSVQLERPVVDGTFAYWLAGALPLQEEYAWRWHTWRPTVEGVEISESPVFRVTGRETLTTSSGQRFDTWVVSAEGARGSTRMWIADRPPYLVRQDLVMSEGEEPQTVIELKRLRPQETRSR